MLKLFNWKLTKPIFLSKNFYRYFTVAQPNNITKTYEGVTDYANIARNRDEYRPTLTKGRQKALLNRAIRKMKTKLRKEAELAVGEQKVEGKEEEAKSLYKEGEEIPFRKYDRISAKELYWKPRVDGIYEYNNRKISYLTEFQEPFTLYEEHCNRIINELDQLIMQKTENKRLINVQDPLVNTTELLEQDPAIKAKFKEISEIIPKIHYKHYPNLALNLAFRLRYKEDFAKIWEKIETELFKVLHNITPLEIAKLKYAFSGIMPKAGSYRIHRAFAQLISQDLGGCNLNELLHIYQAFRNTHNEKIHLKIFHELINRGPQLIKDDPDSIANVIYTYMNCRIQTYKRSKFREPDIHMQEANQIFEKYFNLLEENIKKMSNDALCRLGLALSVLYTDQYGDIALKIERAILSKVNNLDAFQTATIIYAFSKMKGYALGGRTAFYEALEPNLHKLKGQFNTLEMSRIIYAYTARNVASKKLVDGLFLPWIKKNLPQLNYAELANIAYTLMFLDNKDESIWREFAKAVSKQKLICSLNYFKPLKMAELYMKHYFPTWDLSAYEDTIFEASREYNTIRQQKNYEEDEYVDFSRLLILDLKLDVKIWLEWENLLIVDYAILPHKVGILLQKKRESLPFSSDPSPRHLLKIKILEMNGWKILNVGWEKFHDMGDGRKDWLESQINKMIKETQYRVEESENEKRALVTAHYIEKKRAVHIANGGDRDLFDKMFEEELKEQQTDMPGNNLESNQKGGGKQEKANPKAKK